MKTILILLLSTLTIFSQVQRGDMVNVILINPSEKIVGKVEIVTANSMAVTTDAGLKIISVKNVSFDDGITLFGKQNTHIKSIIDAKEAEQKAIDDKLKEENRLQARKDYEALEKTLREREKYFDGLYIFSGKVVQKTDGGLLLRGWIFKGFVNYRSLPNLIKSRGYYNPVREKYPNLVCLERSSESKVYYVANVPDNELVDDDTVSFLVRLDGTHSYNSVLGANNTVTKLKPETIIDKYFEEFR